MIASAASVIRSRGGRGKKGLAALREYRQIKRELREEDSAEAVVETPPRFRGAAETRRQFANRMHRWMSASRREESAIRRLNNVFKLRKERAGVPVPLEA